MKIAICDDQSHDCELVLNNLLKIEKLLACSFKIAQFYNGEDLLEDLKVNKYDVIILDILMGGIDGIEVATRLKVNKVDSYIIFVSSYDDRVKELFKLNVISFIDKPVEISQLKDALLDVQGRITTKPKIFFSYKKNGMSYKVNIEEIIKIESHRNVVEIQTISFTDTFYGTLLEVWGYLSKYEKFIMPQKSFIFNLNYVLMRKNEIELKASGQNYTIGRKYKEDTLDRYIKFIKGGTPI